VNATHSDAQGGARTINYGPRIYPPHAALLEASALTVDHVQSRGYQSRSNALEIPLLRKDGSVWGRQDRFDIPGADGLRYKTPARQRMGIDVPPGVGPLLNDPKIELWITEGVRKADSGVCNAGLACIALLGVDGWRGTNTQGGKTALAEWADIALNGRSVVIAYDSDVMTKGSVQHAVAGLSEYLTSKGAAVSYCHLPSDGGEKVGLDDYLAAGHTLADLRQLVKPDPPGDPDDLVRLLLPRLDWHELWAGDQGVEWLVFPLLPKGRLVALFSPPEGWKSLLMLHVAAALSTGRKVLGQMPARRYRVLYVDFENDPRGDVLPRLEDMGYGPDELDHLDYLSFPSLAYLDSPQGGRELMAAARVYRSEVVIVDTISRAVAGPENDNDTWLNFYRHTGLAAKRAGLTVMRLDHTGKDESKGQRGGSAKGGDIDAAWQITKVADRRRRVECVKVRFPLEVKSLNIIMREDPLRLLVENLSATTEREAKTIHIIALADEAGLSLDAGWRELQGLGKAHNVKARTEIYNEAARRRKAKYVVPNPRNQDSNQDGSQAPEPTGTNTSKATNSERKSAVPDPREPAGTSGPDGLVPGSPSIGGNQGTVGINDPEPDKQPDPCPSCAQPFNRPNDSCSASRFHGSGRDA
jgi:hypothetical protein